MGIGSSMVIAAVLRSGGPAAGVAAGAEPIAIDWRAPAECPSADELRAGVVELLGTERASERVRVEVAVERRAELYVATMVLDVGARRSERELVAEHCRALADATALVIAVTVDPMQAIASPELHAIVPEPAIVDAPAMPTPLAEAELSMPTSSAPAAIDPPRRRRTLGAHLRALGGLDVGATPDPTGMVGVAVGLRGRWFRAELEGSWAFARTRTLPDSAGASARIARGGAAVRGCGVPGRGRIEVPLCAAIEAGALVGTGAGATVSADTVSRPWVAFSAGPALAISVVPRFAVLIGADVVVPLWRATFEISGMEVFRPNRVGMRALLGLELRLGARP